MIVPGYDSVACYFDSDFLGKTGVYNFTEGRSNDAVTVTVTMSNLCKGDYKKYFDINGRFGLRILFCIFLILLGIGLIILALYEIFKFIKAFKEHLQETRAIIDNDMAKLV